jgi:plastocyanin
MSRLLLCAAAAALLAWPVPAGAAAERPGVVGNFYFRIDEPGAEQNELFVDQGDRIRFRIGEWSPPAHTVTSDDLGFDSGDLFPTDTYLTPPLNTPGTYRLYCRPHADRGHVAALVVRATAARATAAPVTPAPRAAVAQAARAPASSAPPAAPGDASPAPTPAPAGSPPPAATAPVMKPTEQEAAEVAAILASAAEDQEPWTRALKLFFPGLGAVVAAAGFAVRRDSKQRRLAEVAAIAGSVIVPPPRPAKRARKTRAGREAKPHDPRRKQTRR